MTAKKVTSVYQALASDVLDEYRSLDLESDEDQQFAAEVLREVKEAHSELEEKRKSITGPINEGLRAVNDLFRPARLALEECERSLKKKLVAYQERKELANRAALELAASAGTAEEAGQAIALVDQSGQPKGISVRYVWRFEIVAASEVPREFWSPDTGKIKAWLEEDPDKRVLEGLPGVKFFQEPITTVRRIA